MNLPVVDHEEEQDGQSQDKVNQIRENDYERKDLGREHDLLDEIPTGDENHRGLHDRGAEPGPGKNARKEKQSVGFGAFLPTAKDHGKNEPIDEELKKRVDKGPQETQHRASVAGLELPDYQTLDQDPVAVKVDEILQHVRSARNETLMVASRSVAVKPAQIKRL